MKKTFRHFISDIGTLKLKPDFPLSRISFESAYFNYRYGRSIREQRGRIFLPREIPRLVYYEMIVLATLGVYGSSTRFIGGRGEIVDLGVPATTVPRQFFAPLYRVTREQKKTNRANRLSRLLPDGRNPFL